MPLRCVLHAGIPKTGSSSIQESLYYGLNDPRFRYLSLGDVTGDRILITAFSSRAHDYHFHHKLGLTPETVSQLRNQLLIDLARQIDAARQRRQTVVFSAECFWVLTSGDLASFRDFMSGHGYTVEVLIYLRPWKSWLESCFQEYIKLGGQRLEVLNEEFATHANFLFHLQKLDEVFGPRQVSPVLFQPSRFPNGCVVQDFCARMQIPIAPSHIRRVNEGLSLPALKLLFAYRQSRGGFGVGLRNVIHNEMLFQRLREVPGPPVRFHSQLVNSAVQPLLASAAALQQRLEGDLGEDLQKDDRRECLRTEADLCDFSRESLEWLGRATGRSPIHAGREQEAVGAVAEQVHQLCENPSLRSRLRWHQMIFSRRVRHWLRDV
jgi:hypothetical protein